MLRNCFKGQGIQNIDHLYRKQEKYFEIQYKRIFSE